MITLHEPSTRHALRGFWLTLAVGVGVACGLVLGGLTLPARAASGAGAALLFALPGWLRPTWVEPLYAGWNRLARLCARGGSFWVSGVIFFVLVTAVGRGGSRMPWAPRVPGESGWVPREQGRAGYASLHDTARSPTSSRGWARSLTGWASETGNGWAWGLLPLLALLHLLRPRQRRSLDANIYTLY